MRILLFICSLCFSLALKAQIKDFSLPLGFTVSPNALVPVTNTDWVAAVQSKDIPYGDHKDSLYLIRFNYAGQIKWTVNIAPLSAGKLDFFDLIALPGGSVLATYGMGACDFWPTERIAVKINAMGTEEWSIPYDSYCKNPFYINAIGQLILISEYKVHSIDFGTGAEIESFSRNAPLDGQYYCVPVPGTLDFIALGTPTFQLWKKSGNAYSPNISNNTINKPEYSLKMINAQKGIFWSSNAAKFYYLYNGSGTSLTIEPLTDFNLPSAPIDFQVTNGGNNLLVLCASVDSVKLLKYDFNGALLQSWIMPDKWQSGLKIREQGGFIMVLGKDHAGPKSFTANEIFENEGTSLWLRIMKATTNTFSEYPNVGVSGVMQGEKLQITTALPTNWSSEIYRLSGGKFMVQVKNYGATVLQDIQINIRFNTEYYHGICLETPAIRRTFNNLNLSPSDAIWLNFGDIDAPWQSELPSKLCFWTSSPNRIPDGVHSNDWFCSNYTVNLNDPGVNNSIQLFPDPADDGFFLYENSEAVEDANLKVYDILGRTQPEINLDLNGYISTKNWLNGVYWIQNHNQTKKILVQH